ncbi:MAG: aldehyde dehydrogenase family protein [Schleiferiaceae bacterium]|jgi:aldehyde dehydrogenase (NAD+)
MEAFTPSQILESLNLTGTIHGTSTGKQWMENNDTITSNSPIDNLELGSVSITTKEQYDEVVAAASEAFKTLRSMPAPKRGELMRQFGNALRQEKAELGALVSLEMGKSYQEGLGEVQEMIDICDFAVGLSRQLYGLTIKSERTAHHMMEQWHPLGVVGVISAFNFPVAVWAWNFALAVVCGNTVVWKGSEKAPLCAVACQHIWNKVAAANNLPEGISSIITGDYTRGEWMTHDERMPLISATGSTRMGRIVGAQVASRFGKSILELGGNNAIIITPTCDLKMTVTGALFGAVGTCGQRCTSTRRLIIHDSVYDKVKSALIEAYGQIKIGNPLDESNHVGPLIDQDAVNAFLNTIKNVQSEGGKVLYGGEVLEGEIYDDGFYVQPCIVEASNNYDSVQKETFAPILYLLKYEGEVENAIAIQNDVKQGLSSAIMTSDVREAHIFLSESGSDCGIANVNIGTSGAEIGGAFGGEKETGGGRESGSDAWKAYMRRQTNTLNYGKDLPLAQGIEFNI